MTSSLTALPANGCHVLAVPAYSFTALPAELLIAFRSKLLLPGLAAAAPYFSHVFPISADGFTALFSCFLNSHNPSLLGFDHY
jgi:hypothetical protein